MTEFVKSSDEGLLPDPQQHLQNRWYGHISERFLSHAANSPDTICLVSETGTWKYCEVEVYTNELAKILVQKGVDKTSVVAIIGKRVPALSLAMLAVIRAGAAFLIIDPKYPVIRIQQYLDYAKPVGVINLVPEPTLRDELSAQKTAGERFWLDIFDPVAEADFSQSDVLTENRYPISTEPGDKLYIAFTSGTTGVPKAIVGSHSPVSHFFFVQSNQYNIGPQDRISVLSGLAHDPLLRDVLMPLWVGASSWYPPDEVFQYPGRLLKWMQQSGITIAHLTPSLGHFMLQIPEKQSAITCNQLRLMFFGGETLPIRLVHRIQEFAPSVQVVNCYGATETPQIVGWHNYQDDDSKIGNGIVPIGKGIDDIQLLILNENRSLCRVGELGEIFVRTPYLPIKVEHITGEANTSFSINPYTGKPTDRMYATGDYGKYLSDGTVVFHGRKDRQVKIRGFRVDLSEVETVIRKSEQIDSFELIAHPLEDTVRLELYATLREESHSDVETLHLELARQLPTFMLPEQIYILPLLPRTPNGKVDRKKLLEITDQKESAGADESFIKNSTEDRLLAVFKGALGNSLIRLETELAKCGIDSLKTVELCCLIEEEFDVEISTSQLMSCPSVSSVAALLKSYGTDNELGERRHPAIKPVDLPLNSIDPKVIDPSFSSADDRPSYLLEHKSQLVPDNEPFLKGIWNRLLQLLARVAPDVLRVKLHRWRGVHIGENVSIGYDTILETSYPYLVSIGNNVNIGMRVTIIGHFRGLVNPSQSKPTVRFGDYSFIGPGVIILPNTEIGEGSVVAAGSVVTASVPPMTMVQGNPAKIVALCGIPLSGRATYREFVENLKMI